MEIHKQLKDEIWEYCRLNDILNIDEFTLKLIKQGFTVEKYGATPVANEKIIEKIVEKIVEVKVEVERIVEVPVTMVDNELADKLKEQIKLVETLRAELVEANKASNELKKEIEIKKERKDMYGE